MPSLTAAQKALLIDPDVVVKLAAGIEITSPLRYCSAENPVQLDSNWYSPRVIQGDVFELAEPQTAKTSITIDNTDGIVSTAWYAERFSDNPVDIYILLRKPNARTWTEIIQIEWTCEFCRAGGNGQFLVFLHAAAGHRPRGGLRVGNRSEFEHAPEPGEVFKIGDSAIVYDSQIPEYRYYGVGPSPWSRPASSGPSSSMSRG